MLVFIEMKIAFSLLVLLAEHAISRGELGHDQPTSAQVADEPPENRVSNTGHRRQHSCRSNVDVADGQTGGDWLQSLCPAHNRTRPTRVVPGLAHRSILLCPCLLALAKLSPRLTARAQFQVYPR